jgi:hypothetical protein
VRKIVGYGNVTTNLDILRDIIEHVPAHAAVMQYLCVRNSPKPSTHQFTINIELYKRFVANPVCLGDAIENGSIELIYVLYYDGVEYPKKSIIIAYKNGFIDCVRKIETIPNWSVTAWNTDDTVELIKRTICGKNTECIKFLYANIQNKIDFNIFIYELIEGGQTENARIITTSFPEHHLSANEPSIDLTRKMFRAASIHGRDMLKFLYTEYKKANKKAMWALIDIGDLQSIEYLLMLGATPSDENVGRAIMDIRKNNHAIIELFIRYTYKPTRETLELATDASVEIFALCSKHSDAVWDRHIVNRVRGDVSKLEYMLQNGYEFNGDNIMDAIESGNITLPACSKFLYRNCKRLDEISDEIYDQLIRRDLIQPIIDADCAGLKWNAEHIKKAIKHESVRAFAYMISNSDVWNDEECARLISQVKNDIHREAMRTNLIICSQHTRRTME